MWVKEQGITAHFRLLMQKKKKIKGNKRKKK